MSRSWRNTLSFGVETSPPIGVEKGPRYGVMMRAWVAWPAPVGEGADDPSVIAGRKGWAQARFLNRQLTLPVSTMAKWCVRRSSRAAVIFASPNTLGHSPKARLVVTSTDV